jgi:hypothetical protein
VLIRGKEERETAKRKRIYFDTTIISQLDAVDAPDIMQKTREFWRLVTAKRYDVVISKLTYFEVNNCPEPKRSSMIESIFNIPNECILSFTDETPIIHPEAERLSNLYIAVGGFTQKNIKDAQHIAIATICECDIILSWNFKHMVNPRAVHCVKTVNLNENYKMVNILTPEDMLAKENGHGFYSR